MKKYVTAIVLIFLLVLITGQGCRFLSGDTNVQGKDYHVGYQGLVMNFLRNAPPARMYDNNEIKISLELRNRGTCSFSSGGNCRGYIQVGGFDKNIIRITEGFRDSLNALVKPIPNMEGKSVYNSEGGYNVVSFPEGISSGYVTLPEQADFYSPTIMATACYTYVTEATAIVCVDPDPYGLGIEDKVCTLRTEVLSGGQGAPVAVTRVESEVISPREGGQKYMQFKIFVENAGAISRKKTSKEGTGFTGSGIVVDKNRVFFSDGSAGCAEINQYDVNKIYVSSDSKLSTTYLDCFQNGEILLDASGNGFAICKATLTATGQAYTAPLFIKLLYGYVSTVSTNVEIVQVPGGG